MGETTLQQRAQRVKALAAAGLTPARIRETLSAEGMVSPVTGQPYSLSTLRRDLALPDAPGEVGQSLPAQPVREMVGRVGVDWHYADQRRARTVTTLSVDRTRPDYANWDKLRRGVLKGFEIGGLFCRPITDTLTSFVVGKKLTFTLAEGGDAQDERDPRTTTDQALEAFADETHPTLQMVVGDHYGLGDQFVIVNPDASLSVASPETVEWETDPLDYRKVVRATITTRLEQATIADTYTPQTRTKTVKWTSDVWDDPVTRTTLLHKRGTEDTESYANLFGEIPVVHFACEKSANEVFGHPIYQALFRLFSRYDDLIEKAVDGVELLALPIPTFTGIEDVAKFIADLKTVAGEDYTDADGNADSRTVIKMDDLPLIVVGKGGDFKMVAPEKGFTTDILNMLKTLFVLICYYSQIPEFAFGAGMDATRASTETQMPVLVQHVELLRARLIEALKQLVRLHLKALKLTQPRIVVDRVRVTFPEISLDTATVRMQKVIYAKGIGGLTTPRAVEELQLVADAHKDYQLAQQELESVRSTDDDYLTQLNAAAHSQQDPARNQPNNGKPGVTSGKPPLPAGGRRAKLNDGSRVGEMSEATVGHGNGKRDKRRYRDRELAGD